MTTAQQNLTAGTRVIRLAVDGSTCRTFPNAEYVGPSTAPYNSLVKLENGALITHRTEWLAVA